MEESQLSRASEQPVGKMERFKKDRDFRDLVGGRAWMEGLGLNTRAVECNADKHQMDQTEETGEKWASTVMADREDAVTEG